MSDSIRLQQGFKITSEAFKIKSTKYNAELGASTDVHEGTTTIRAHDGEIYATTNQTAPLAAAGELKDQFELRAQQSEPPLWLDVRKLPGGQVYVGVTEQEPIEAGARAALGPNGHHHGNDIRNPAFYHRSGGGVVTVAHSPTVANLAGTGFKAQPRTLLDTVKGRR